MDALTAKSRKLTGYLEFLINQGKEEVSPFGIITPDDPGQRGAQLSIRLSRQGRNICDKLAAEGVIGDWREPDTFRVAAVPLYNSYVDVFRFVQHFSAALQ